MIKNIKVENTNIVEVANFVYNIPTGKKIHTSTYKKKTKKLSIPFFY